MTEHRGRPEDITEAYYRGLMHAVGYRRSDLDKPQIAVTMGCFLEAVGLALFGSATMLAFDGAKLRQARDVGERIVALVREGRTASHFLNRASLENGVKYISASGGSTNAVLHLVAIASLLDVDLDLDRF